MTPYRLVTIGQDGLARLWDIREAALKRCSTIRSRSDYLKSSAFTETQDPTHFSVSEDEVVLPPLPITLENDQESQMSIADSLNQSMNENRIVVPRLPHGTVDSIQPEVENSGGNIPIQGDFVAGNEIDEGVKLLAVYQHGDFFSEDPVQAVGTRSRRKKVRVLCLSRCPAGGHFATGSDDGVGRIWLDEDDEDIDAVDQSDFESMTNFFPNRMRNQDRRRSARANDSIRGTLIPIVNLFCIFIITDLYFSLY